jgi:3-hydroxyisobutyrate dehydrogenase-like beta-hydroxyacid dehydrogenase
MSVVGVVGLGAMGSRIARRLLDGGHEVHGTNRAKDRAAELIEGGLVWHDSPAELARAVGIVISMVTDDEALFAVTGGPDGIIAGLARDTVYIDMSSVSPNASIQVASRVRQAGARMLDAPVSGSVPQAEQGSLAIMVGGDETVFHKVESLLLQLGQTVTPVGGNGAGAVLKLAINISLAVQTLAFSEGLLLAERSGLDPKLAAEVMSTSPIGSPMLKARVPLLLDLPDDAWFSIRLMRKDISLALAQARRLAVATPAATTASWVFAQADALDLAERDIAAIHNILDEMSSETRLPVAG